MQWVNCHSGCMLGLLSVCLMTLGEPLRAPMAWPQLKRGAQESPEWPPVLGTQGAPTLPNNRWFQWVNTIIATSKIITLGQSKGGGPKTRKPPSWRSFRQVSVSGIDATMDRRSPPLRRVLWASMLIVCTSLMLAQCLDRILRYADEPVTVNVRVTHNESLAFPAITLCNKNPFNRTAALELSIQYNLLPANAIEDQVNVSLLMGMGGMSVSQVWERIAYNRQVYIPECWVKRKLQCDTIGQWSLVHTVIGPCFTYKLNVSTIDVVGSFSSLFIRQHDKTPVAPKGETGVRILLHEPRESPVLLARTHSISAELGWSRDIKLEMRKFQMLDTVSSPCVDDVTYSRAVCNLECFQAGLNAYSKCRMPFMIKDETMANTSECNSPAEYENGMNAVNEMLLMGGWNMNECGCDHECFATEYQSYPNNIGFKAKQTRIRLYYSDLVYEHISEERAYPMISLLCDIGGTLGLLMGASVLTVCELLEVAWSRFLQGCCRLEERRPPSLQPEMRQALAKLRPAPSFEDSDLTKTMTKTPGSPLFITSIYQREVNTSCNGTLGDVSKPSRKPRSRLPYAFE